MSSLNKSMDWLTLNKELEIIEKLWMKCANNSIEWKPKNKKNNKLSVLQSCQKKGIVQFCHQLRNYPHNILHLAHVDAEKHAKIIKKLTLGYNDVIAIYFLKCKLSIQILVSLKKYMSIIEGLHFRRCRLGNIFFNQQFAQMCPNLQILHISSDSFGNQGFKNVMSLNLPMLNLININNANITTDCIKVLRKKQQNRYRIISFTRQKYFCFNCLVKQCQFITFNRPKMLLMADFQNKESGFFYSNQILKMKNVMQKEIIIGYIKRNFSLIQMAFIPQVNMIKMDPFVTTCKIAEEICEF